MIQKQVADSSFLLFVLHLIRYLLLYYFLVLGSESLFLDPVRFLTTNKDAIFIFLPPFQFCICGALSSSRKCTWEPPGSPSAFSAARSFCLCSRTDRDLCFTLELPCLQRRTDNNIKTGNNTESCWKFDLTFFFQLSLPAVHLLLVSWLPAILIDRMPMDLYKRTATTSFWTQKVIGITFTYTVISNDIQILQLSLSHLILESCPCGSTLRRF